MQDECRQTTAERVRQENQSLAADLAWLENEYPMIKEAAIAAEHRRRRVEARLRDNGLLELVK